jgi:SAM-dependent methyltransferase
MTVVDRDGRQESFGQGYRLTPVDRFGIWLNTRKIRGVVPTFEGLTVADLGCGYNASFTREILPVVRRSVVVDIALAADLKRHEKVTAIEGTLPEALSGIDNGSIDVAVCSNVVEHLWEPLATLREFRRIVAAGGVVFINVPSWRGKWFLEFSAFRLGLSPASEMNDHKMYYDPQDLWPLLVRAGFIPQFIRAGTHKLGLNTYAVCRTG